MLVSAPLCILGRPFIAAMWAIPAAWRPKAGAVINSGPVDRTWHIATNAGVAWAIHAAALWIWHLPVLFQATLENDAVHTRSTSAFSGRHCFFGGQ